MVNFTQPDTPELDLGLPPKPTTCPTEKPKHEGRPRWMGDPDEPLSDRVRVQRCKACGDLVGRALVDGVLDGKVDLTRLDKDQQRAVLLDGGLLLALWPWPLHTDRVRVGFAHLEDLRAQRKPIVSRHRCGVRLGAIDLAMLRPLAAAHAASTVGPDGQPTW